ncbi:MAG: hypothetical protein K8I60_14260 [Anaerolineae bacterium]|nr:hypothetical protein [Anaerolineae bacterium]
MQFQTFDEVDWPKVVDADEVCLVVPLTVIDELDKHKNDPISDRRRKRARLIIGKLQRFDGEPVHSSTSLLILQDNPKSEWFDANNIDFDDNDKKIIGTAKWFQEQQRDRDVVTVSGDYGFRLRAKALKVVCVEPNDHLKQLGDEPDPQQKEIADLKQQVIRLQNAMPKLSLHFRQGNELVDCLNLSINFDPIELTDEEIDAQIKERRIALGYDGHVEQSREEEHTQGIDISCFLNMTSALGIEYPSKQEVEQYHLKVDDYLEKYREYLPRLMKYKTYRAITSEIILVLENSGSAPADDIDMYLHFPNGFTLREELLSISDEPSQPPKPKPRSLLHDMISPYIGTSIPSIFPEPPGYIGPPESNGPVIRKSNSYDVNNDLDRLKQHHVWDWPSLYATFHRPTKLPIAFNVEYEITAANIPDVVKGKLIIKLAAEGTSS